MAYLDQRGALLHETLTEVNVLVERREAPNTTLVDGVLKVTPLTNVVPPEADALARQTSVMLPRIKITNPRGHRPRGRAPSQPGPDR
jgi:hypothetical protein